MALDDPDVPAEVQGLVMELARLAADPTAERRARIMAAVRGAPSQRAAPGLALRTALAAAAAAIVLIASSVGAVAASGDALPSSPNYPLRSLGEQVRLTFADPATRQHLRISFARSRISQAQAAIRQGDQADAKGLLRDSRGYLNDAQQDLHNLGPDQQGAVQQQLNQAEGQQTQAEGQLSQQGEEGQSGG